MNLDDKEKTPIYGVDEDAAASAYLDNEFEPEEDFIKMPKAKIGYSLICLIIVAVVIAINVIAIDLNSAYTYVAVYFSDITYGYNPDGSPFNIYDVLSDESLEIACEKLDHKVDAETLKKHISISSVSDTDTFNALKQNILDGDEMASYIPSSYKISYEVVSDTIMREGPLASIKAVFEQFTMPSKTEILQCVAQGYKEYYESGYIVTSDVIFDVDWSETESLDYFNRASEMTNILNHIMRYTDARYADDLLFDSKDGVSFGDISSEISRIIQNDIESYKSFVVQNGITADRDRLLKQFTYVLNTNKEQVTRSRGEYSILMDGISIYDPNVTKLVFIPSIDSDGEFYMNRTKIGIDYLTESASKSSVTGDTAETNAQYYEYLINQFTNTSDSDALREEAEERCDAIIAKVDDLCERAADVNDEFLSNHTYNEVKLGSVSFGEGITYSAVSVVKLTLMWVSILYVLWVIYSCLHKKKRRVRREEKYTNVNS